MCRYVLVLPTVSWAGTTDYTRPLIVLKIIIYLCIDHEKQLIRGYHVKNSCLAAVPASVTPTPIHTTRPAGSYFFKKQFMLVEIYRTEREQTHFSTKFILESKRTVVSNLRKFPSDRGMEMNEQLKNDV